MKFVKRLRYYLSLDLKIVKASESKHYDLIIKNCNENCPIGMLEDIEIVFVHYKDPETAYRKWTSRIGRVNFDNLTFKFSLMNYATIDHLKEFDRLDLPGKKFMFVNNPNHNYKCGVYYHGFENDSYVWNDTFFAHRYFDVTRFLNEGVIIQK